MPGEVYVDFEPGPVKPFERNDGRWTVGAWTKISSAGVVLESEFLDLLKDSGIRPFRTAAEAWAFIDREGLV